MKIEKYLSQNEIGAEVLKFDEVRTVADCARHGIGASEIVKSILLILDEKTKLLCVLMGSDKIDFKKIRKLTRIKNIRTANPEEVLEATGFEVGGVISTIPNIEPLIDSNVLEKEEVYSGGGDSRTLLKLKVSELQRFGRIENFHREEDSQDLNIPKV